MGLVRKKTLKQLIDIDDMDGTNIGEKTSKGLPVHLDTKQDNDLDYDSAYNQSNVKAGNYGMGNFGEYFGDIINNNKYSNLLSIHNPLKNDYIPSYEDFGVMSGFGDYWHHRKPTDVQKFDTPDSPDDEPKKHKKVNESNHIMKFDEFKRLDD